MTNANILVIDIERIPGIIQTQFWDLGQYKNRRLPAQDVIAWPKTICLAYRWYGTDKTKFTSIWDDGYDGMLRKAWKLLDKADVVVGHNYNSFDGKKMVGAFLEHDVANPDDKWGPPSPSKTVDTYREAARCFGFESNTLDAINTRLGIVGKTGKYSVEVALAAVAGDKAAQAEIEQYNIGDVDANYEMYELIRGWIRHPNLGLYVDSEVAVCINCQSTHLQRRGYKKGTHSSAVTGVSIFQQYQCMSCGKWQRGKKAVKTVEMRA